ncbi:serine/threonine-protein phosphatase 1 regulatory subunit 10-like isoform X2 [Mercenaria mercenaria]|uniref:serine/threonine-protein phosphatase 1 regulatory subunit 10-like isoform X2 n=1 Tax=Mercenaria mercenaria TaxID=6596 RepID=UPI00234E5643|nr:serine/threonine-protein phosphatase 1 regulatory subunit 10-like isoform X2 [Mercenaria mercenaria]
MAPLDPQQLLKALNELLGPNGAIMGPSEAVRVANLMKDANKLVSKCIYINILKVETSAETLEKLLSSGGWDTINSWLQEAKETENYPLLVEILKVYQLLPITVDILKKNNAAKTIKQLCKSENENTKTLATNIFDEWMKKVKGNNNNNDTKKKKDKVIDKDRDSEKKHSEKSSKKSDSSSSSKGDSKSNSEHRHSTENRTSTDSKSKSRDSKHSHDSSHHHKSDSSKRSKEKDKKTEEEDSNANDSVESDDKVTVRQGSGLKLHIKLGSDKERTGTKSDDTDKKRISTVKRPPSKFRSTGLEEASGPSKLPKNADLSKPIPKRTGSDIKSELPSKRSRPNMPPPLSVPSASSSSTSTPSATSPQSPGEIHGKIKIIPARPKPNHVLHESSGFMDSLDVGRPYGSLKKKRRLSGASTTPPSKSQSVPTTPPSPVSPTTAIARSLPSVPSFYKDTQETESTQDNEDTKEEKKERSPSPTEVANGDDKSEVKSETSEENKDKTDNEKTVERSPSPTESLSATSAKESKGLLTTGATKVKKKKKSVSWKEDHEIKEIFYFEMDEEERVNVNRPKDFNQAQRNEMMADRRAFESSVRMKNDHMVEQITWYRPKVVIGYKVLDYGKDSKEKTIQKLREQSVLQALFFHKNMLPDNPQEPDMENEEPEEPKTIPVDDMSGGEEFLYNYDSHPQAVQNQGGVPMEPIIDPPFQQQINSQQPPTSGPGGPGGFSLPPGLQLPPDLANILSHMQNTQSNPNDPVMVQVQQILNNLMCGGSEQSYEQLQQIQQIMNSQMGLPADGMMQGPPPGMGMMGMPPGGPPMGPRTLLGNAPPGFMPQRPMGPGPGPNRFGPPGNWGPQGNMGGPQMGQQGGNFRGGMRGQGQGRGPRGGRGGNFRVLCRHFASGKCRMGNKCTFLHPGINGPPLSEQQMQQMLDNPGNS